MVKLKVAKKIKKLKKPIKAPLKKKVAIKAKKKIVKPKPKPKIKTKARLTKSKTVKLKRAPHNPIISPRMYPWESKATFNPTAFISDGKVHIIYRAIGEDDSSVLGYAVSNDGHHISDRPTYFVYKRSGGVFQIGESLFYESGGGASGGCEDPRVTKIGDTVYMLYTAFDGWGSVRITLTSIKSDDLKNRRWRWTKPVFISPPGEVHKNWALFPEKINGKFAIIHNLTPDILIEYVDSMDEFDGKKFIQSRPPQGGRDGSWDNWVRGIGPAPIKTDIGWLVLYHAMDSNDPNRYKLGAMVLDLKDPTQILYRAQNPILEPEEHYENEGWKWGVVYSCGAVVKNGELFVYYGGADKVVCVATVKLAELISDLKRNKVIKLKKDNPLELE